MVREKVTGALMTVAGLAHVFQWKRLADSAVLGNIGKEAPFFYGLIFLSLGFSSNYP
jgi:hypothetical protein